MENQPFMFIDFSSAFHDKRNTAAFSLVGALSSEL